MRFEQSCPDLRVLDLDVPQLPEHRSAFLVALQIRENAVEERRVTFVLPMLVEGLEIGRRGTRRTLWFDVCRHR